MNTEEAENGHSLVLSSFTTREQLKAGWLGGIRHLTTFLCSFSSLSNKYDCKPSTQLNPSVNRIRGRKRIPVPPHLIYKINNLILFTFLGAKESGHISGLFKSQIRPQRTKDQGCHIHMTTTKVWVMIILWQFHKKNEPVGSQKGLGELF